MGSQASFRIRSLVFALALFGAAMPAKAQSYLQSIGVPPFSTQLPVENGFVNVANGNLHLEIPLGTFPQRSGASDKIVMMYDSAIWSPASGAWGPNFEAGWRLVTSRDPGYAVSGDTYSGNCAAAHDYYWDTHYPWIWVAPDGTQHAFPASVTTKEPYYPNLCNTLGPGITSASGYATDGSGYYISITNYTNWVVYAPDGTQLTYCGSNISGEPACPLPATEDSNGNYTLPYLYTPNSTNNTQTWTWTDTLGRTVLTEFTVYQSNVYTFTVPNPPGAASSQYTVTWETINVDTNFGQSGIYETSGTRTVVKEIDLPDGTKYTFTYDSGTTPGYYGELTSMTMPTGATIQYGYGNYSDAYNNVSRWLNSRATLDGTWGYVPVPIAPYCAANYVGCGQQVTVTKPSTDTILYDFVLNGGSWPDNVKYRTGSSTTLASTNQCFSFATMNPDGTCSYSYTTGPAATTVHLMSRITNLTFGGGTENCSGGICATTTFSWDSYDNPTQISEWGFGHNPYANPPDRSTTIAYATPGANVFNRPSSVTVKNSAGAIVAQTNYGYDFYTYNGGSLVGVTATGHDTNYGTNITARGNLTSIQNLVSGSTYLSSYFNYDTTGQVTNAFDINNQKTAIAYTCQNAYPTSITNPLSQVSKIGYDCNTGLVTSAQDPNNVANNQSTSFNYDNMFRPTSIGYPDGGQTTLGYTYTGSTLTGSTSTKKVNSTQNLLATNTTDGLGRVTSSVTTSDPDGSTTVTTSFDTNSRVKSVSNPYRNNTPNGYETYVYDALDRVKQVTHVDGHVSSVYYGPSVGGQGGAATQLCAAGTYNAGYPILKIDEANNKLQSWIDGLGRTIEADEPTATSASLTANTCYGYDANNNVIGVLAAGGLQTRTLVYDDLSRLKSAKNPETGTTATVYTYDADGNCAAPNSFPGDLVSIVDPRGIRTCMRYGTVHRPTTKTYSDGTPTAYFRYDQASQWGYTLTNPVGRLTQEYTDTTKPWSSSLFGYDPMGRVVLNNQCTPASCGTSNSPINYTYDYLGNMATYTNGAGVTITQSPFNAAGRLTSVTSSLSGSNHPGTLLTNVHYNALGEPSSGTLGNGAVETLTYAPRGWPLTATAQSESTGTPGRGSVTINGSEQFRGSSGSQGANTPGTFIQRGGTGLNWGDNNNNYYDSPPAFPIVTQANGPNNPYPNYLLFSNFVFNVPTGSTITGVVAAITKEDSNNTHGIYDDTVQLIVGGSGQGGNKAQTGQQWPPQPGSTTTYGSSSDTWSNALTPALVNDNTNFGITIRPYFNGATSYPSQAVILNVTLTIYYTATPDSGTVSVTVGGSTTQPVLYSSSSTGVLIAGQLASEISGFGFVTASNNNTNVITIQSTTNGSNTNYSLSASSQSNAGFNPPSFTTSPSGANLTGGTGSPTTLYSFSLGYGAGNANVTSAIDSINGTWAFTYDYLNRLSTANQNNGLNICSYGYDQLGNRTSQTATAGSCGGHLSLSYAGNNNRMDGYTYDLAGNLLGDGVHTYAYDAENRLISVDGGNTASYIYNAEGRRVQKKTAAQVEYLYDVNGNIMTELSSTGVWNRGEVFANGQHLATYLGGTTGTTYFDHADWLGTERARSNTSDADCETITNLPFGDSQSMSGTCADANPLHFTGQQWDSESGLHYFGARHYSSQFGRFMSPDPTGIFLGNLNDPQSLNLYSYVRNNPTSMTDPSGLQCDEFDSSDCGGCDFCIGIGISIGWGGGGWGQTSPGPPIYSPPNVGTSPNSPNGTLASDDPFSGETNGIPNGLKIPTLGLAGILLPTASGCDFGGCGFTAGGTTWRNYANYLDWLLGMLGPDASLTPGLELIRQQIKTYSACVAAADKALGQRAEGVETFGHTPEDPNGGPVDPYPEAAPGTYPEIPSPIADGGNWYAAGKGISNVRAWNQAKAACDARTQMKSLGQ